MTARQWVKGRKAKKLTQVQAAAALGVTQPYLSQLEKGHRVAASTLARRAAELYGLPPTTLPLPNSGEVEAAQPDRLQEELAALGYPAFAHVPSDTRRNPAQVVLSAVLQHNLDTRLVEALPWVMGTYTDLDWAWLRDHAKLHNVQNRLGYVVFLAKEVASRQPNGDQDVEVLSAWEQELEEARLAREGTLCRESMPERERTWLKSHRPPAAAHWNLLTGLTTEQLSYAASGRTV